MSLLRFFTISLLPRFWFGSVLFRCDSRYMLISFIVRLWLDVYQMMRKRVYNPNEKIFFFFGISSKCHQKSFIHSVLVESKKKMAEIISLYDGHLLFIGHNQLNISYNELSSAFLNQGIIFVHIPFFFYKYHFHDNEYQNGKNATISYFLLLSDNMDF